ncbi:MISP protein, partial [Upupa epops]|nr:MISP protein [Upupa epops]
EEDEQERRRLPPPQVSPEKARELEDERREVIRSQVVRKSSTMAERWSSVDELSAGGSFTSRSAGPSPKKAAAPAGSDSIDTEQINFSAARQQFLMLEQSNPGSFFSPEQQVPSPKPEPATKVSRQEQQSPGAAAGGYGGAGAPGQSRTEKKGYRACRVAGGHGPDKEAKTSGTETPIEREIRMALEREENLWRERGIQRPTAGAELVEIQTRPVLSMRSSPGPGGKGADKGRASLYVRREIEQETRREEDLRKQGRLLGTYDRGPQQQLDERRRVFEREEAPPQKPTPSRRSWANESVLERPRSLSLRPAGDTVALLQQRFSSGGKGQEQPPVAPGPPARASRRGSEDSSEGRAPSSSLSPAGTAVVPREYFSLPFWKPRVSFADAMGSQKPLRGADSREEQYSLRTWKPQTSALIEEEIRSDLQREEELQEQRRRRQLLDSPSLGGGDRAAPEGSRSRHSSAASGVSGSYSVSGSPASTPTLPQPGVLALVSSFTPLRVAGPSQGSTETLTPDSAHSGPFAEPRKRVKEDGKYAGIEPVDRINTEVVESTRVVRHQSSMGRRWEAGQFQGGDD